MGLSKDEQTKRKITYGHYLKKMRLEAGFTYKQAARKVKVNSLHEIFDLENGRRAMTILLVSRFCKAYKTGTVELRKRVYLFELDRLREKWGFETVLTKQNKVKRKYVRKTAESSDVIKSGIKLNGGSTDPFREL